MKRRAINVDQIAAYVLAQLKAGKILLETDNVLPSIVRVVVGGPVKGSWLAHPLCHEIYAVCQNLSHHRDLEVFKLVNKKRTYLHRSRWPELYAVARMRGTWQTEGLSKSAKALLARVDATETLRMDELRARRALKELGEDARILESRLLVFGDEVHTESGAHVKRIETWSNWARRVSLSPDVRITSAKGRAHFDSMVESWRTEYKTGISLPWDQPAKKPLKRLTRRTRQESN